MAAYWYETQERAMAPGIADSWPEIIKAPHTKNGRLVRRNGDPTKLLDSLKECRDAVAAAMRVIADLDTDALIGLASQRFVDELKIAGVKNGFGQRANTAIAKAEGH